MSKVNEALFDLIHSLSKTEKRYFKLHASRNSSSSENNSTRLFDAISQQKAYDEEKLFKQFEGEAFLNRFSITKKRLYDHILSVLDDYHSSNSIEAQLFKMIQSADILYNKSLYNQAKRVLKSAEKLALKNQKNEILLLISNKYKRLIETEGVFKVPDDLIDEMYLQSSLRIKKVSLYNQIWTIKSKLFERLFKKGVARTDEEIKEYRNIMKDIFEIHVANDEDVEIKYLYFHTLSAFHYSIGSLNDSFEYMKKNLTLLEDRKEIVEVNKQVSVLTNAIFVSDKLGLHKDSVLLLKQLKMIEREFHWNEDLSIKIFSSVSSIELNIYLRKGDFEKAMKVANQIKERLDELGDKIVPIRRAFFSFKIATIYMGINDFSNALTWVNEVLSDSQLDKTEDIIGYTQLLELLIHIEMNHNELLPYSLKNTLRFFKTRNRLYTFEKTFLQFIRKLINCKDQFEIESIWEDLYNEMNEISSDSFENIVLEYFDFKSWVESKFKKKSFQFIVKERYNESILSAS